MESFGTTEKELIKNSTQASGKTGIKGLPTASRLVRQAERLIIWGYSLGTFDADIIALIGNNTDRNEKRELIVVNTDPFAFQRALALTGITNASFYDPGIGGFLCLEA